MQICIIPEGRSLLGLEREICASSVSKPFSPRRPSRAPPLSASRGTQVLAGSADRRTAAP